MHINSLVVSIFGLEIPLPNDTIFHTHNLQIKW